MFKCQTTFLATLDVRTAVAVAVDGKGVDKYGSTRTRGGGASGGDEGCGKEGVEGQFVLRIARRNFGTHGASCRVGVVALVFWRKVLWKAEEKWKAKGLEIWFVGDGNDGYRFSSMTLADNYLIFRGDMENSGD